MTLVDLLRKSRAFALGATLAACTYPTYEINNVENPDSANESYTCEDIADKLLYCGAIKDSKGMLSDCHKGLIIYKEATEKDIVCVMESSCEHLTNWSKEACKR